MQFGKIGKTAAFVQDQDASTETAGRQSQDLAHARHYHCSPTPPPHRQKEEHGTESNATFLCEVKEGATLLFPIQWLSNAHVATRQTLQSTSLDSPLPAPLVASQFESETCKLGIGFCDVLVLGQAVRRERQRRRLCQRHDMRTVVRGRCPAPTPP